MTTPHIYTSAKATVLFARAKASDISRIYLTTETWHQKSAEATYTRRKVWDAADVKAPAGLVKAVVDLTGRIRNHRDVRLELECATDGQIEKAGVRSLKFEGVFQHNMFARPYLVGGRNRVTVKVANPESLKDIPLRVTYAWKEGRSTKTHAQLITQSPMTYTIDVSGKDLPRMVRMEMSAGGDSAEKRPSPYEKPNRPSTGSGP
jgi:hypothetical protein